MKGPAERPQQISRSSGYPETSSIKLAFLGLIAAYQKAVSPVGAGRCAFSPSCSAFSADALREKGVIVGIIMTADRLMRDHPGVLVEGNYTFLPNGTLYDPVALNSDVAR